MKTLGLVFFLTSFSCFGSQVSYTDYAVPFECQNFSSDRARLFLEKDCEDLGEKLVDIVVGECSDSGGDGGYVNYFKVTAYGICEIPNSSDQFRKL
jgi:hypothetical protein